MECARAVWPSTVVLKSDCYCFCEQEIEPHNRTFLQSLGRAEEDGEESNETKIKKRQQ